MCTLGKEIEEILVTKDNPIVGVRLWTTSDDLIIRGLQYVNWNGKSCVGDIDKIAGGGIPLGIYSYSNYCYNNYYNYCYNNYNYYNNYYYNNYYNYYYNNSILGEVNIWGRIKKHDLGYRSENAEVKTLFLLDIVPERDKIFVEKYNKRLLKISEKYSIPTMTEFEYLAL